MKEYRVLIGINYPDPKGKAEKRAEPGDIVSDLPAASLPALLEQRVIEDIAVAEAADDETAKAEPPTPKKKGKE